MFALIRMHYEQYLCNLQLRNASSNYTRSNTLRLVILCFSFYVFMKKQHNQNNCPNIEIMWTLFLFFLIICHRNPSALVQIYIHPLFVCLISSLILFTHRWTQMWIQSVFNCDVGCFVCFVCLCEH